MIGEIALCGGGVGERDDAHVVLLRARNDGVRWKLQELFCRDFGFWLSHHVLEWSSEDDCARCRAVALNACANRGPSTPHQDYTQASHHDPETLHKK